MDPAVPPESLKEAARSGFEEVITSFEETISETLAEQVSLLESFQRYLQLEAKLQMLQRLKGELEKARGTFL